MTLTYDFDLDRFNLNYCVK